MPTYNRKAAFLLTWRGKEIEADINQATIAAMRETLEACVTQAKLNAPVLTGALRDDISYDEPQEATQRITARWGNRYIRYSLFQELGWRGHPGRFYLRRAADQEYPLLAERIRRNRRDNS